MERSLRLVPDAGLDLLFGAARSLVARDGAIVQDAGSSQDTFVLRLRIPVRVLRWHRESEARQRWVEQVRADARERAKRCDEIRLATWEQAAQIRRLSDAIASAQGAMESRRFDHGRQLPDRSMAGVA
jgi:hypothetical protein